MLSKSDYTQQTLLTLSSHPFPDSNILPPSTVLIRTTLIALTTNNLSYARGGSDLHWWSTYPVPLSLPKPYNSSSTYGIVPAWGYGTIIASSIPDLQPNTLLWGYFPTSTLPILLFLKPSPGGVKGHWIEHSLHRENLMPLYQRYVEHTTPSPLISGSPALEKMAWRALLFPLWESAYLLNRFVFPQAPTTALHPLGGSLPWPASSADLTNALVILFAASGKTALSFAQQLKCTRSQDQRSPLAVVGVTSEASRVFVEGTHWLDEVVLYSSLEGALPLILANARTKGLSHAVVIDFGSRVTADQRLHAALAAAQPPFSTVMINVGAEPKLLSAADSVALSSKNTRLGKVQMNTSGLRMAAIKALGEAAYFNGMEAKWKEFLEAGQIPGMRLRWGDGMEGEEGVGERWRALCGGEGTKVRAEEGMVSRL